MIIECNGMNVDLTNKLITFKTPVERLDMSESMQVSKLYQRLSTFEVVKENATEELNNIEAWNVACVVREAMTDKNLTEEEAFEEVCPGLVKLS
ncbi:hypothetical protein [Butyrivibrio sp.]|uniref:hypothetical protein n=1 Tax=Butyrivibrio sp. TaxID=28121 RepID=UPI0025BDC0C5|nr:hypothetical protein [Butyrivibrio sp.]MBQ7428409.1 hypothetical protein [Butyrivibrio sp.]MBQ9303340.1 hypothetical protein [Butyrivibrio sp.]